MLSAYARKVLTKELGRTFKTYKHNKYKFPQRYVVASVHSNPTFPHAYLNLIRKNHSYAETSTRRFKDTENVYAYNILQSIPVTNSEMFPFATSNKPIVTLDDFNTLLDQSWRLKSAKEIVDCFTSTLDYCIEHNINLSDNRFDKLVDGLMDRVEDLTDSELSQLLMCLAKLPVCDGYTAHNFHDMWSALDDVCCWKLHNWSNETRFVFAELWYQLNLGKLSDYVYKFIDRMNRQMKFLTKNELIHVIFYLKVQKRQRVSFDCQHTVDVHINDMSLAEITVVAMAYTRLDTHPNLLPTVECMIRKLKQELPEAEEICVRRVVEVRKICKYTLSLVKNLSTKPENLTKVQLIHTFFYLNVCRKCSVDLNFEQALQNHIHSLTADEMAIVAMGFFKSQSNIRLKLLLGPMIKLTKNECQTMHEITLTAILKVLRYSSHVMIIDQLMDLLDCLVPEIDRLSNLCCIHIALLGTTLQFFHQKSLEEVSKKIIGDVTDPAKVRLKDMERLLVALAMFDFEPKNTPDVFARIYEELNQDRRRIEFAKYPRCLPSTLGLLSIRKIYSYDLMDELLNMDSVTEIYGKSPTIVSRDIFCLDVSAEIECPDYTGSRLDPTFRRKATKWKVEYTPTWDQYKKLTAADKFVLELTDVITKIVEGRQNVHVEHVLPNFVKSDIVVCMDKKGNFVQPCGFDRYILGDVMRAPNPDLRWLAFVPLTRNNVIKNTSKPLGLINMKCRQLKTIGYEPILVIWNEFLPLLEKERIEYIRNKISR